MTQQIDFKAYKWYTAFPFQVMVLTKLGFVFSYTELWIFYFKMYSKTYTRKSLNVLYFC